MKDLPPIPKSQPNATTPETEAKILECSLAHPSWGCVKLSDYLKLGGVSISSPTVQKVGELLSQDTFMVGNLKGVGTVYLHACVDTYGSYAFGFLHTGKKPECAAALVLAHYSYRNHA